MAGSGPGGEDTCTGGGDGQKCNCLYCTHRNKDVETIYSSGCDDNPNWACKLYFNDWGQLGVSELVK